MYLEKETIDEIFEKGNSQYEVFLALYHEVHPKFDKVKKLKGYPRVGKELHTYLFQKFIDFDKENHPGVLPGGLWLNKGFSLDESLEPFEAIPAVEVM